MILLKILTLTGICSVVCGTVILIEQPNSWWYGAVLVICGTASVVLSIAKYTRCKPAKTFPHGGNGVLDVDYDELVRVENAWAPELSHITEEQLSRISRTKKMSTYTSLVSTLRKNTHMRAKSAPAMVEEES